MDEQSPKNQEDLEKLLDEAERSTDDISLLATWEEIYQNAKANGLVK